LIRKNKKTQTSQKIFSELPANAGKDEILNVLRDRYKNASQLYGSHFFNLEELEKRISHMSASRLDFNLFMEQELNFFYRLEASAMKKQDELKKKDELNKALEKIMSENDEKIKHYPSAFIDNLASYEIRKLSGAISQYMDICYPIIKILLRGSTYWNQIHSIFGNMERFYQNDKTGITMLFKHYIDELIQKGEDGRDKIERNLMQTGALLLYRLELSLKNIENDLTENQKNLILEMPTSYEPKDKKLWEGKTHYEIINKSRVMCANIIDNFRLNSLAEHAYNQELKE